METSSIINAPQDTAVSVNETYKLSGPEKAAVILALLGTDNAGPVVEKIEDKHLRAFMRAMENLKLIPRETMLACVADFITELNARQGSVRGGAKAARELAESLFEQDRALRLFGAPPPPPPTGSFADEVWEELKMRKDVDIINYLSEQPSEVVSIVMSNFPADRVGEILIELPENISVACVREMSRDTNISSRTIDAVAELIQTEFLSNAEADSNKPNSVVFVTEILGILPSERRDMMLDMIEKTDAETAEKIRKGMMTFEDLPYRLPTTAVPIIFKDFDQEKLILALKAGAEQYPATVEFLFANISQRMAGQFKEQIEEMGDISQKVADSAISSIMSFLGRLEKTDRITFIKPVVTDADE
ncbi:MAG: FliG C-terminal domain-containing protein [Maricaulaceae bacterium]